MSLSKTALERLESHWAVASLDAAERARGLEIAQARLVNNALGRQLRLAWDERPGDEDLLRRLAMACEMAAIEGLPALVHLSTAEDPLREQCVAAAWRTFALRRLLPVPQREHEKASLDSGSNTQDRAMALRLIAFYHWAKATELLAKYVLQGEPRGINALLDKHFEAALDAAMAGGEAQLEVLVRWLHATARQMVSGSPW